MPLLEPFEAFRRDVALLGAEDDESRVPTAWLAAAQIATRLADATEHDRHTLVRMWAAHAKDAQSDSLWRALAVPGVVVTNLATAGQTLVAIARQARLAGALNLAYCVTTHARIALMSRGPASARVLATVEQAEVLRAMHLPDETLDTFEAALEDAIRADDQELERSISKVLAGLPPRALP